MCSFKDNPVPSLDKRIKKLLELSDLTIGEYMIREEHLSYYDQQLLKRYTKFLLKTLQNGVETDKEQPIKDKCSCKTPHYGFKTIAICTDCNGIKDDEYWKNLEKKCSCMDYPCDECDNG